MAASQQGAAMQSIDNQGGDVESPDRSDRMKDFWNRHGGPSSRQSEHSETEQGTKGWSEVYAADGYTLRCDWWKIGCQRDMRYIERPPPREDDSADTGGG
jgi:hypothetical protein